MGNTHQAQKSRLEADASKSSWNSSDEYEWGYGKERGPDTWWIYYPAASGHLQSPINISSEEAEHDHGCTSYPLKVEYPCGEGNKMVWNTGNSLQVEVRAGPRAFYITGGQFKTQQYELRQFHLHWGERDDYGSEHTVDGRSYAMELHFVHWNPDFGSFEEAARCEGGLIILCVFANLESRCNSSLETLTSYVQRVTYKRQFENLSSSFDIKHLLPKDIKKYWTYKGSLTTPPCYESVQWIIFYDHISVSSYELSLLRTLHNHCPNDRPPDDEHGGYILKNLRSIQPIGARKVNAVEHSVAIGTVPEYFELYDTTSVFTSKDDFTWTGGLANPDD